MVEHKKIELTQIKTLKSGRKSNKTFLNKTVHLITGSCAQDLADYVTKKHIDLQNSTGFTAHKNDNAWDFCSGYNNIAELCKTGWITGTNSVCDFSDKIRENVKKNAKYDRDTTGLFFDITDVIAGVPECYFKKSIIKKSKEVQLNINITGAYNVPAELLHNRGAAILALVKTLQAENWRVKLSLFACFLNYSIDDNDKNKGYCVQRIDLDTKPLDVSELSLILAHPGFMRRIGFAAAESAEQVLSLGAYGGGTLGKDCPYLSGFNALDIDKIITFCKPETSENSIDFMGYVLKTDTQFNTAQGAAKWVQAQIVGLNK